MNESGTIKTDLLEKAVTPVVCNICLQGQVGDYALGECAVSQLQNLVMELGKFPVQFPRADAPAKVASSGFRVTPAGNVVFEIVYVADGPVTSDPDTSEPAP